MEKPYFIIISLSLLFLTNPLFSQKKQLTLEDIVDHQSEKVTKSIPNINRWADDENYVESIRKNWTNSLVNVKTGDKTPYKTETQESFRVDKDGQLIYFSKSGEKTVIKNDFQDKKNLTPSPDYRKVAFTFENNLYVLDVETKQEIQLTDDGTDKILNGISSWVYYEEILNRSKIAMWWSPDSKSIAFFRSDDTKVPIFPIYNSEGQHGSLQLTPYPQPGDPNPEVRIGIANIENGNVIWPELEKDEEMYLGTPFWQPSNNSLWIQWMNRDQNILKMYAADRESGKIQEMYKEEQPTWIDWKENIYFLEKQSAFIIQSDKDGWDQIYLYDMKGSLKKQITKKEFWSTKIQYIDESKQTIFFTASGESPVRTDLYSVKFDGSSLKRLTFGPYDHMVKLSPSAKYFITTYSNTKTPQKIALVDARSGKIIREIADSKSESFDEWELSTTEIVWYTTSDGLKIPAIVKLPANLDTTKKHPVSIQVYGGPNSAFVADRWWGYAGWQSYEGIICVFLDHRGSGHLGKKGMNFMHRNLGKYEISDFTDFIISYLYEKPYVDRSKIAIEGQSYGGYLTALAVTKASEYFKYGIANYGVMDWTLYDTHYTERYMDTPESNPEGYKESSVLNYVKNYDNDSNRLFIRHGMADDNVHIQNSIQLVNEMQNQTKYFDMKFYPGCGHSFLGPKYRSSAYDALEFYYKHLLQKEIPAELTEKK